MTLADLIARIEEAQSENATQFIVVALTADGDLINATGPFDQAEQALLQGAHDEAAWRREACPEDGVVRHVVLPLWEPRP